MLEANSGLANEGPHSVNTAKMEVSGTLLVRQQLSVKFVSYQEEIMRRQTRPFTVEVKQKRSHRKRGPSIWGDVDFSAALAETTTEVAEAQPPEHQSIDSNVGAPDAENSHQPQAERLMADPLQTKSAEIAAEPAVEVLMPETKKKAGRPRKARAEPAQPARKNAGNKELRAEEAPVATPRAGRKVYSEEERVKKLGQIEKSIRGGATLKSAAKDAGISEQTYYHWKKAEEPASGNDDLKDLLALEEENKRLKSLLAQRLRKENAELKKKLGLG